jgi:hypothetical protein
VLIELSLLRNPSVAILMAISALATMAIALPQTAIPYMFETPTPNALRNQILTGIAAKEHIPVALIQPYIHFQGDINYTAGFSVFQIAWR